MNRQCRSCQLGPHGLARQEENRQPQPASPAWPHPGKGLPGVTGHMTLTTGAGLARGCSGWGKGKGKVPVLPPRALPVLLGHQGH